MNKIVEIFKAWSIAMSPDEEQNRVAASRLETCSKCVNKKRNEFGVDYCGLCGCPLKGKVFTPIRVSEHLANPTKVAHPCPGKYWEE